MRTSKASQKRVPRGIRSRRLRQEDRAVKQGGGSRHPQTHNAPASQTVCCSLLSRGADGSISCSCGGSHCMSHSTQPNVTLYTYRNWWLSLKSLESRHLSQVEVLASWILLSKKVPRAQNTLEQRLRFKLFQPRSDLSCPSRKQLWTGTSGTNCSPPFLPTTKAPTFIICNRWCLSAIYQTPALSDPDCTVQFPQYWLCAQTLVGAGDMAVAAL